ncbi:hypothetical protein E4U54_002391 [Claviceps lovelessii]|nr:hypothetical protein E4U54_002391 [Claviceps lovelessii]
MKLLSSSALAVTLLAGHGLADCGTGTFSGSNDYTLVTMGASCSLRPGNEYVCGDKGASLTHEPYQFIIRAGSTDTSIAVWCNDSNIFLYHCAAGDISTFNVPRSCKQIESVHSTWDKTPHNDR